jgi:hypothetical protein
MPLLQLNFKDLCLVMGIARVPPKREFVCSLSVFKVLQSRPKLNRDQLERVDG